ncbi:MAG: S-methyl-5-thioribose-1-phosphate isomerase [Gammaproteobacteria bacterium]|nr:S-methyl-5-thioribose-1-phosphate isomerase [Gammaproteobacteria bacterium]
MREQLLAAERIVPLEWKQGVLCLLDQRQLPLQQQWIECRDAEQAAAAIRDMVVRGAPAIGIAAAYGVVLAARQHFLHNQHNWRSALRTDMQLLAASRPTAVNLFWALEQMQQRLDNLQPDRCPLQQLESAAVAIHQADREANLAMAQLGMDIIQRYCDAPQHLLTHCNAGALATGGFGTALGVIRAAHLAGLVAHVHADETRPWLQGSRLTAWELAQEGIAVSVNADSAAAHLLREGDITWVIVGADRITANGDVANKIGTYSLAVLARHHDVRLMVVAPGSTIDMQLQSGADIPIEQRGADELLQVNGQPVTTDLAAFNPVFDVTPASLVDVIVTERGVVERPDADKMRQLMAVGALH